MIEKHQASMRKTAVIAHNISSKLPTVVLHRMYTLVPMSGKIELMAKKIKTVLKPLQWMAHCTRLSVLTVAIQPILTLNSVPDGFQS